MKNKKFFYLQYNKINWKNREKTKINENINKYIIESILQEHQEKNLSIYDAGFGIGFFFRMLHECLSKKYRLVLEGCEPSLYNFNYFKKSILQKENNFSVENKPFLETSVMKKFDYVSAIYVFPHFTSDDLEDVAKKIYSILNNKGKFILVVANETYINQKLQEEKDLFIETNSIEFGGKLYKEVLHYSDIPDIGKLIDYNREERFYIDLFENNKFKLDVREDFDDNGFIATIFVFEKC